VLVEERVIARDVITGDVSIIENQPEHLVFAVRVPKVTLQQNHPLLVAISEYSVSEPGPSVFHSNPQRNLRPQQRQLLFPVPSCVVFGRRLATSRAMPDTVRAYSGTLPLRDAHEAVADQCLTVLENAPKPAEGRFTGGSAYRASFRQGATLVPRMLCLVERRTIGRLGGDPTAPFVVSRRNSQEKKPWTGHTEGWRHGVTNRGVGRQGARHLGSRRAATLFRTWQALLPTKEPHSQPDANGRLLGLIQPMTA